MLQTSGFSFFLRLKNISLCVQCVYTSVFHIFFIHSSSDGHLGCFHVLAVVTSAAVNVGTWLSL